MEPIAGPLRGVRVLDLANESGAYCGKLLADLGADVIVVEPPGGSPMRRIGPFYDGVRDVNRSLFFWHYRTNMRSVVLDLAGSRDRERFRSLAATADIVLETGAPGTLDRLELGYAALSSINPGLVMVSITPFGQTGPRRFHRGGDLVAQAAGGMLAANGAAGDSPLQGVGLPAYHSAGLYGAVGALLAALGRTATGRGQWVDVSLQESVAACVAHASSVFHEDGRVAQRQASLHWTGHFRVGRCADGFVLHCTLGDWTALVEWMKADGSAQDLADPVWENVEHRRNHCAHAFDVLDHWTRRYRVSDLIDGTRLRRLAHAPVRPPAALLQDEQLRARGFFVAVRHDELGITLTYPGAPYRLDRTQWRIRRRPPLLGEHTDEVFREIDARPTVAPPGHPTPPDGAIPGAPEHGPLRSLRVLDFTWVVAGPLATRILADHGAEVVKIERPDALDAESRRDGLRGTLNRGKQSLVLDLARPAGLEIARRLVAASDVVIDNFSPRVMSNWGLGDAQLRQLNARVISVHMSGFGQSGPYRDLVSYGPTVQALCGHTWLMQSRNGAPVGWGFSYSDMVAGVSAAVAILAALWHRQRTGEGQCIDLSQFENLAATLGPGLLDLLRRRGPWPPIDNQSQEVRTAPHGVYRCADRPADGSSPERWCAITVFGEDGWRRFCRAVGNPAWTREPRFTTVTGRLRHRAALDAQVEAWTRPRTAEAVVAELQAAGVAAALVADADDLCRRDPHLQARHYWVRLPTPEGGVVELDGIPFKMSATPGGVRAPAPLPGEHTGALLQRILGMTADEIAALRATRVVA
jgi:crotonobetainyl-CoA:carnitine CoA-transferase CaiB-like acyl-CoA transferase